MKKRKTHSTSEYIKSLTNLNVSADVIREARELTDDYFLPLLIKLAERSAKLDERKTILERDYVRAKDWIVVSLKGLQ